VPANLNPSPLQPPKQGRSWRSYRNTLLGLVAVALLFVLLFRRVDIERFKSAFLHARWSLVAAAAFLALLFCAGSCIMRLYGLLRALPRTARPVRLGLLSSVYLASTAAHNLLPSFAGDAIRSVQLYRLFKYPATAIVAVLIVEKVVEALGLGLISAALLTLSQPPAALRSPLLLTAVLSSGGFLALVLFSRFRPRQPSPRDGSSGGRLAALRRRALELQASLRLGFQSLGALSTLAEALFWSMLADGSHAVTLGLCLLSVGISLPISAWMLLTVGARLSGIVPTTPGTFGVVEGALVLMLGWMGVPAEEALSAALIYHAVHFVPSTVLGLFEWRRQAR
jgi:uncharacterized membrane protein YbhN (UPF0104 family)